MSKFIELTKDNEDKIFVNTDNISYIQPNIRGCIIRMNSSSHGVFPIEVAESYNTVVNLIQS